MLNVVDAGATASAKLPSEGQRGWAYVLGKKLAA